MHSLGCLAIWNDIDVYYSLRDFTSDPVSYPGDVMREFTRNMVSELRYLSTVFTPNIHVNSERPRTTLYATFTFAQSIH